MAARESVSAKIAHFSDAISYSLVQLREPEITFKKQKKAILAVYKGRMSF